MGVDLARTKPRCMENQVSAYNNKDRRTRNPPSKDGKEKINDSK